MAGTPRTQKTQTQNGEDALAVVKAADSEKVETSTTGNLEAVKEEAAAKAKEAVAESASEEQIDESAKVTDPVEARARVVRNTNIDTTGLEGEFVSSYEQVKDGKITPSEG